MAMKEFPPVSEVLILCLEQRFNCGPPLRDEPIQSLMLRAGYAEVIEYLRSISSKQNTGMSKESTNVLFESEDPRSTPSSSSSTSRRRSRRSGDGERGDR